MRVVRVREFGPPEVLRIEDAAQPRPAAGQVLVAVEVAGVCFGDTIVRSGRYPFPLPYVPGLEAGGRVAAVGPDVHPSLVGTRVVADTLAMTGGYAESALAEADRVHAVPAGLPLTEAVAVFRSGAVAVGLVAAMGVTPDDTVLVTAAAGRIGSLLVQRAKAAGAAQVIGAAAGARKTAAVRNFGADLAVDYRQRDWVARVKEATGGRGADVVFDAVGGDIGGGALEAAADGTGRIGLYGFTSGTWTALDARTLGRRGLTVSGALGRSFAKPAAEQRADVTEALRAAGEGRLLPRVHGTYPLERAAGAHAALEGRRTVGAVLLTV